MLERALHWAKMHEGQTRLLQGGACGYPTFCLVPCLWQLTRAVMVAALSGEVAARAQHLAKTGNPTPVLPFGVTFIGPAWSDESLWAIAERFHAASGLGCGPEGHGVKPYKTRE